MGFHFEHCKKKERQRANAIFVPIFLNIQAIERQRAYANNAWRERTKQPINAET